MGATKLGQEIPGESQGAVRVGEKCRGEMGRHRTVNEREGGNHQEGPTIQTAKEDPVPAIAEGRLD